MSFSQMLAPLIDANDDEKLLSAISALRQFVLVLQDNRSGQADPATLTPYVLARLCEASGISLPGQKIDRSLPTLPGKVIYFCLECLLGLEKICDGSFTPSLLTTPGSLRALRQLLLLLHNYNGEPMYTASYHSSVHTTNTPVSLLLVLLEHLATNRSHGAPRSILKAGLLSLVIAAGLGRGTGGERDGGRRGLEATIVLFNCLTILSVGGREDATCILEGLLSSPNELQEALPFLPRLCSKYVFSKEDAVGPPRLVLPQSFRWVDGCDRHPAVLRDCIAGSGLSTLISHLCALAQGHWRQWGDRYVGFSGEGPTPANWPFQTLQALLLTPGPGGEGGLLHLYSAALAAHVTGVSAPPGVFVREYIIDPVKLKALLLAVARIFKVLRADSLLLEARGGDKAQALEAKIVPTLLRDTDFGGTLVHLLEIETSKLGKPHGSDSTVAALLAALKSLE